MKKSIILLFVFIGFILVGCKEDQQEVISENNNMEEDVGESESITNTRPPNLNIETETGLAPSTMYSYCWDKDDCSLEQKNLNEVTMGQRAHRVDSSQLLTFRVTGESTLAGPLIFPDIIEVTKVRKGNESTVDVNNRQITAPTEKGVHYYNVYAKWEEEIKGEAYYAFKISVEE